MIYMSTNGQLHFCTALCGMDICPGQLQFLGWGAKNGKEGSDMKGMGEVSLDSGDTICNTTFIRNQNRLTHCYPLTP